MTDAEVVSSRFYQKEIKFLRSPTSMWGYFCYTSRKLNLTTHAMLLEDISDAMLFQDRSNSAIEKKGKNWVNKFVCFFI